MARRHFRSPHPVFPILPPPRVRRFLSRHQVLLLIFTGMVILSGVLGGASLLILRSSAASPAVLPSAPASNTFQQFLKGGQQSKVSHGSLPYSALLPKHKQVSHNATSTTAATPPPSAEPPTMQPITQTLSAAFLQGGPTGSASPLDLVGSDGRLEVQVQPGSFDVAQATVGTGVAPKGALSLQVTQLQGYFVGQSVSLGFYQVQLLDSAGQTLSGVQVRTPLTILYHYQPTQLDALGLDPGRILLAFPDLIAAATQANTSPAPYESLMQDDPTSNTLLGQSTTVGPHPFDLVSEPQNQSLPTLHLASMQGNNGQLTYSYPLQVPPGPGGFAPQLQLTYSSAGPNERHVANSPAGSAGDGWSLSLGSISEETYGTNPGTTYYFINDVAGVGDRLVPTGSNNLYDTQHISYLRIQQVTGAGGQPCFDVWDKGGTFYEIGCTTNSLQYWMDTNGTRHNYQWDVDKIIAPNEGPSASVYRLMLLTYVQDTASNNGHTYVRDSALQQIIYGTGSTTSISTVVGTVDFTYHGPTAYTAPSGDSSRNITWITAYGTNYGCKSTPPVNTTLRCDDPLNDGSSELAPLVMSTLTLDSIASYVGSDAATGSSYEDDSYSLAYNSNPTQAPADSPFAACTDPLTLAQEYCAGEHLLYSITPTVYQNNVGSQLHPVDFTYTTLLQNTYYDSTEKINGGPNYTAQNTWSYLSAYEDLNTGVGESIAWKRAYSNTDGTPDKYNQGVLIDDRHDPLYCTNYPSDCTGNFAHPDNQAWSEQVVVSISTLGKDSSASSLQNATTTYSYLLAVTGTYQQGSQYCTPTTTQPVDSDCVGDDWISALKQDWQDYYHAEYQGFAQVAITSPAGDLTVDKYTSTKGWYTAWSDPANFLGGSLNEEDTYFSNSVNSGSLLRKTVNTYGANSNACRNASLTYPACEVVLDNTVTTDYELQGFSNPNAPWVQHTYVYDDYTDQYGLAGGYHNLLEAITSSSNAPSITQKWSYTTNDQTTSSPTWTYYTVDAVTHSEVDDNTGHVWQCQNTTYDENAPSGTRIPAQGLPTTTTGYGTCANQTTPVTTYQDYDKYGNLVASVDGVASANSSLYSSNGCTLGTSPSIYSSSWGNTRYTACTTYDTTYNTLPLMQTNALSQSTTLGYTTEGVLSSVKDLNSNMSYDSYSYAGGNTTVQVSQQGETNSYTTRSVTTTACVFNTIGNALPCYEVDTNSSLYNTITSSTIYDALGRAVETRTPGPGSGYDTIVMTVYDDQAHTTWQSVPFEVTHSTGWLDPNGATDYQGVQPGGTTTFYDPLDRAVATQDPNFGSSQEPGHSCSAYFYETNFTDCTNPGLGTANGDSQTYLTSTYEDPNQHITTRYLDALGRTVYTQEYSSGPLTLNEQTATIYNALDEPTSVTVTDEAPQSGQTITSVTTTASYDDLGRLTTLTDPDRGTHSYTYDADGQVLTDVSGTRTIGYSYDLLGRVGCIQDRLATISPTGACTSGANVSVKNFYDITELGTQGSTDFPIGQLTKSDTTTHYTDGTSATVSVAYQHDSRGRLINSHMGFASLPSSWNITSALPSYRVQYSYNDANQLTTTATSTSPSGQGYTTTQVYDSTTGVLTGLSNNGTASANLATLSYNARAQLDTLNFQTSTGSALLAEQFGYDANLRTTSATASWQSGSGNSGTAFSQSLSYDPASNLTSLSTTQASVPGQSNSGGSETQVFCYDEQNRLTWAGNSGTPSCSGNGTPSVSGNIGAYTTSYVYTHLGQLWQGPLNGGSSQQQYLYCGSSSSQPHQLTGLYALGATCSTKTGQVYASSYDAWGNVTSRTYSGTTATLSYDLLDHLIKWYASSTNQEQYVYDANGERVLRRSTNSSGTTMTVYAFGLEEHSYTGSGTLLSSTYYYSLAGKLIGALDANGTTFYLTDALGSLLASFSNTANSAALKSNQLYGPYGNARYTAGTLNTAKGFTGQYNDALTGLDYYGARYYDPVAGVFLSADTVQGNMQGMNPYGYVSGNPEMFVDPTGHDNDPWLLYVAAWYTSTQPVKTNIINGTLQGFSIPQARVPELTDLPLRDWKDYYDTGYYKQGVGRPDITNRNTGVIWEVKTGGGTGANMGSYLPAELTESIGVAQAMWYAARARATNWLRRSDWQVGSAQSDPALVRYVQSCPGAVCIAAFQDGTVLAIRNPADGLLTYGVLRNRTSQRVNTTTVQLSTEQTETYRQQYNQFTRLSEINSPTDSWDSSESSTSASSIDDMFNGPGWVTYKPTGNTGSGGPPEAMPVGSGGGCGEAGCL